MRTEHPAASGGAELPKIAFFGSPDFAVPCLQAALELTHVAVVISQPDKPAGRGLKYTAPAVKRYALEANCEVWQPKRVRTGDLAQRLRALELDLGIVVAYGRILPRVVLEAPRLGCLNVHASLLPRWRGAAPIQWAIAQGDPGTGISLMQMDEGMDTGPVLATRSLNIEPRETSGSLFQRLSRLGGEVLSEELPRFLAGKLVPKPQEATTVTMAPMIQKSDGLIDWNASAERIDCHIRAMTPWPGAFSYLGDQRVKVHRASVGTIRGNWGTPGSMVKATSSELLVACAEGTLSLEELQLDGRKRMSVTAFQAGQRWGLGTRFSLGKEGGTSGGEE
ncbi:MAG: methionyl-tRNA formyltransferase [Myxococcota bacterium]